jgi:hypothetical protein
MNVALTAARRNVAIRWGTIEGGRDEAAGGAISAQTLGALHDPSTYSGDPRSG